jgi:hypothetical protein
VKGEVGAPCVLVKDLVEALHCVCCGHIYYIEKRSKRPVSVLVDRGMHHSTAKVPSNIWFFSYIKIKK